MIGSEDTLTRRGRASPPPNSEMPDLLSTDAKPDVGLFWTLWPLNSFHSHTLKCQRWMKICQRLYSGSVSAALSIWDLTFWQRMALYVFWKHPTPEGEKKQVESINIQTPWKYGRYSSFQTKQTKKMCLLFSSSLIRVITPYPDNPNCDFFFSLCVQKDLKPNKLLKLLNFKAAVGLWDKSNRNRWWFDVTQFMWDCTAVSRLFPPALTLWELILQRSSSGCLHSVNFAILILV